MSRKSKKPVPRPCTCSTWGFPHRYNPNPTRGGRPCVCRECDGDGFYYIPDGKFYDKRVRCSCKG